MALEGTIKDFGLADIFQLIGLQRKTGVLELNNGAETVTIRFLEGSVVGADTSDRNLEDLLGSVLVRTGRITEAQLQEALLIQKSTLQRLGYVLVQQRFISDADLEESLRLQVTQIVYRLFRWRAGKYTFAMMDQMDYDREHFRPLSAETILMEGARMIDEWPMLERRIKSPRVVFRKTESGVALDVPVASLLDCDLDLPVGAAQDAEARGAGELRISPEERDVLHLVNGTATVQDIVDISPFAEFDIYRLLFDLLDRNLVVEVQAPAAAGAGPSERTREHLVSASLLAGVIALAVTGVATLGVNPVTPWRLVARSHETELLRTYAGRNRLERIEQALMAYYLDRGSLPKNLDALCSGGYLPRADRTDPWGRPYDYRVDSTSYQIGSDAAAIRHPFSSSQRMVLEGGTPPQPTAIRP